MPPRPIECQRCDRYLAPVTKRILLSFLLAWLAIAPAIASACAAGCETTRAASIHPVANEHAGAGQADVPDCHGASHGREDSKMPDGDSMAVACFVASAASLPPSFIAVVKVDIGTALQSFVRLPPVSFETSPLNKPPQA